MKNARQWIAINWEALATVIMAGGVLAGAVFYVGQVSSKVEEASQRADRQADKIKRMEADDADFHNTFFKEMKEMHSQIDHIDQWVKDHE